MGPYLESSRSQMFIHPVDQSDLTNSLARFNGISKT